MEKLRQIESVIDVESDHRLNPGGSCVKHIKYKEYTHMVNMKIDHFVVDRCRQTATLSPI